MYVNTETTVLLVEDDAPVREVVARSLSRTGYTVHECPSGEDAVEFVRSHAGPIDLLLIDTVLGGISGLEAADQILEMRPRLPVLHMSGYSRGSIFGDEPAPTPGREFISKPFTRQELDARIRGLLGARCGIGEAAR